MQRAVQVLAGYPGVAAIETAIGGLVEAANREGKSQGVLTIMSLTLNYLEPLKKYLNTTVIKGQKYNQLELLKTIILKIFTQDTLASLIKQEI